MSYKTLLDPGENPVWRFRTKNLEVRLTLTPDYGYSYDSDDPGGETQAKLDSGEYVAFESVVAVLHSRTGAELGSDCLGGSVYESDKTAQFYTAHRDPDPARRNCAANSSRVGHYFPDMVAIACDQARETLRAIQAIKVRGSTRHGPKHATQCDELCWSIAGATGVGRHRPIPRLQRVKFNLGGRKMGTRANIVAKTSDNRWGRIYTHWDGYPDHHGPILLEHYQDQAKIDELIALGDLSSLAEEIGEKHDFNESPIGVCNAYGRDRGETGTEADYVETIAEAFAKAIESGAEFVYVWNGQSWSVGVPEDPDNLIPLRAFMAGDRSLKQTVKAFGCNFVLGTRDVTATP